MEPETGDQRVPGMDLTLRAPAPDAGVPRPGAAAPGVPPPDAPSPGAESPPGPGGGRPDVSTPRAHRVIVRPAVASPAAHAPAEGRVRATPGAAHTPTARQEHTRAEPPPVDSFDAFYRASRTSIGRALALATGDVDLAADATDEAMARAYERWAMVSRLDRPEGWVYRVGLNWSVSILRRRRRSPHRLYEPITVDGPQVADPDVRDALGVLDVKHRSVVVCRHLLGWSVADTATALGVREGTVKSRLHRALQILQNHLGPLRDLEEES